MSKRTNVVRRSNGAVGVPRSIDTKPSARIADSLTDVDALAQIALPHDHPKWLRDRFVVSSSTKALLARLKPFAIRLLGFWDHRVHRLDIGEGTIQIDDSGAYRSV